MRKKNQITQLETQVSELMAVVNSLLEVVTKPTEATKLVVNEPKTVVNTFDSPIEFRTRTKTKNSGTRWSDDEKRALVKMHNTGMSHKEIGKLMGRTHRSTAAMISNIRMGKV